MMRRSALVASVALSLASLAPFGASAAPDACAAISAHDVSSIIGKPITKTKASPRISDSTSCFYYDDPKSFSLVTISRSEIASGLPPQQQFAIGLGISTKMYGAKAIRVAGIGDEAATVTKILYVRKGGAIFTINIFGIDASIPGKARAIGAKLRA